MTSPSKHRLYGVYSNMIQRCYNHNNPAYANYGARGIKVCETWLESFWNFVEDMGERPKNYTLDRVDNDKGYEPTNCKWSSKLDQNRNRGKLNRRRKSRPITVNEITLSLTEWSRLTNQSQSTLSMRVRYGWSDYEVVHGRERKKRNYNNEQPTNTSVNQQNSAEHSHKVHME